MMQAMYAPVERRNTASLLSERAGPASLVKRTCLLRGEEGDAGVAFDFFDPSFLFFAV